MNRRKHLLQGIAIILLIAFGFFPALAQVNLQTGSATFSIPVFNWQDNKSNLNTVVALSYNSGNGLKVNDVASNVGQGWSTVAGGVITRMQVGEPDDQIAFGNPTEKDLRKYPNGYLYADKKAFLGCPEALLKYPLYKGKNQLYKQHNPIAEDRELDYFSFQFNGKSGIFVLNTAPDYGTGSGPDVGAMLGDSKIKISFQRDPSMTSKGIRTTISSFIIQDVDGLLYKFSQPGLTKVLDTKYCDADLNYQQTQPTFKRDGVYHQTDFESNITVNPFIIGSWYLKEIEDPLTHRKVLFNFVTKNINAIAGVDISYYTDAGYSTIYHKKSITQTPQLSSIIYPDGHQVNFNEGAARVDLNGATALASIDIQYQNRYISKYLLNTSYFILNRYGTPVSDYQKSVARLCLQSVQKIGVDLKEDSPPYLFDYYKGSSDPNDYVPPPFFFAKDVWGFYNGDECKDFYGNPINLSLSLSNFESHITKGLCFLRNTTTGTTFAPKPGYAKNGLLKQVIYPTGGTLSYTYDQNNGPIGGVYRNVGGVHVVGTSTTDGGGSVDRSVPSGNSNGCDNPISTAYNYVLNAQGTPSLWGLEMPMTHVTTGSFYGPEEKRYKAFSGGIFGECYYRYMYPGILSIQQALSLTGFQTFMEAAAPMLGILSTVSTIMDVAAVLAGATGFLAIAAVAIDVIGGLISLGITCLHDYRKTSSTDVYYNFDLNNVSPLPAQFKRLEVIENPGTIGKTVYEFTSEDDYPVWEPTNPNFSVKQRFAPWDYGLTKKVTVFNAAGSKVKETENTYYNSNEKNLINMFNWKGEHNPSNLYTKLSSCKCKVNKTYSQKSSDWTDPAIFKANMIESSTPDMTVEYNAYYTGRIELTQTNERVYDESVAGKFLETITNYSYNIGGMPGSYNNYEISSIRTKQSNGAEVEKRIEYFNSSDPTQQTRVDNNIITLPYSTSTSIRLPNQSAKTVTQNFITYAQLATGAIQPSQISEKRFSTPQDNPLPVVPTILKTFTYDAAGNLIGVTDEGSRKLTNLYDYADKFVTATIINADPLTDKSFYTSFETSNLGGWQLNEATAYQRGSSVTGNLALSLPSTSTLTATGLNTAKEYRLSFWADAPLTVTGGATLQISNPTINGFTYYEYAIATGTATVTIRGTANLDELRLCPKMARMNTVTYDPLIGKTSECDQNNRITYYEYDNLGRLLFIKDEQKNVVKMYEYNSKSNLAGCPKKYYNHAISEIFTKNDCGAGFIGNDYVCTIPAAKYSSTKSQFYADFAAAMELITLAQQAANQNAGCKAVFYNQVTSQSFATENCADGFLGGSVTYTVPAGRYRSLVSQADANAKAQTEIMANGQAFANDPANAVCTLDRTPRWEAPETANTQCQAVGGENHLFILATDVNPNSPSYNQTQWKDMGTSPTCPPIVYVSIMGTNNTNSYVSVSFVNAATNQAYYFYLTPFMMNNSIGSIPAGNYNISIGSTSDGRMHSYLAGCSSYYGYGASFPNRAINSSCNTVVIY